MAAIAVLAAGCGGSSQTALSKADYVSRMQAVGKDLSTSLDKLSAAPNAPKAAAALEELQTDLRDAADQLDSFVAPAAVGRIEVGEAGAGLAGPSGPRAPRGRGIERCTESPR